MRCGHFSKPRISAAIDEAIAEDMERESPCSRI
jgi:hypothetical protein